MIKLKLSDKVESPEFQIRRLEQENKALKLRVETLEKDRASILKENFVLKSNKEEKIFRIIYFRPRLADGIKLPVAILSKDPKERYFLLVDIYINLLEKEILKLGLDIISSSPVSWDKLPESIGPHFELGPSKTQEALEKQIGSRIGRL
jgi:hypothetical protein